RAISFAQVLKGNIDPKIFQGKIVLIGRDTESDSGDYIRTPFSKDILAMSRLEAHANILDTLILNSGIRKAPDWFNILVTALISIFTSFVVFGMRPGKGLVVLALMVVSFCSVAYIGFAGFRFWIGMAHPLLAIFISYYFFIPYRLIQEYRKRWEYQQKHALITQVEELKTNFLSMMSHDLKTPLARIQGMTEMAMAQPQNLSETQVEALQTINQSSDELSNFISSVLNLTRIESKELKLHLQSKDINQLLEDVVKKYQFLAKSKNIEIVMEMEPIFSTKVDVDLMKQVLGNLVENGIKYSPEGSKILVSTEEKDNQIVIQVADQGVGIPKDELSNVFMKFYRSKNAKSSPVKGSGLGLYLAKYFVELHQGKISVESVPHEGSTFTVELPMDA
ncbi:MAG: CHASE2 domain-containing protein, partial [Bdellovibrionales bacterium]|nr:CHASE2 domain-containing protein [Bdellovibrionales bacterium]